MGSEHFLVVLIIGFSRLRSLVQRPVGIRQVEVGDDPVWVVAGDVLQQFDGLRIVTCLLEQEAEVVRPADPLREIVFLDDVVAGVAGAILVAREEVVDQSLQFLRVIRVIGLQGAAKFLTTVSGISFSNVLADVWCARRSILNVPKARPPSKLAIDVVPRDLLSIA